MSPISGVPMKRCVALSFSLVLATSALHAQGTVQLVVDRADVERGDEGVKIAAAGAAPGVPDRTRVRVALRLGQAQGPQQFAEVTAGRFTAVFGPARRRLLPGTYELEATVDPSVQRLDVAALVSSLQITPGKRELQVGTVEEATAERAKLARRYGGVLEDLRLLFGDLEMWGNAVMVRSVTARARQAGALAPRDVAPIRAEWERYSDEQFAAGHAAIRFDLQQLNEFVVISYFPGLDPVLTELLSTLDRLQAGYTVGIYKNVGLEPPAEILGKGRFALDELRERTLALSREAYAALGARPTQWRLVDQTREHLGDADGDLFRSTQAKFEVKKPALWTFNVAAVNPMMRIRMFPPEDQAGRAVSGVELHDHMAADSFGELADLDEALTRNSHPGFELKKVKRFNAPDATMPGGVRPGQEMQYVTQDRTGRWKILQYSLFCRWHKRTYTLMCIAQEPVAAEYEATFRAICDSFKVLDAPHPAGSAGR